MSNFKISDLAVVILLNIATASTANASVTPFVDGVSLTDVLRHVMVTRSISTINDDLPQCKHFIESINNLDKLKNDVTSTYKQLEIIFNNAKAIGCVREN